MYHHTKDEGNNEVLKTLTKTLTFVDTNANAEGSTIALRELCSGKLKTRKCPKDTDAPI